MVSTDDEPVAAYDALKATVLSFFYKRSGLGAHFSTLYCLAQAKHPTFVVGLRELTVAVLDGLLCEGKIERKGNSNWFQITLNQWLLMTRQRSESSDTCTSQKTPRPTGASCTGR